MDKSDNGAECAACKNLQGAVVPAVSIETALGLTTYRHSGFPANPQDLQNMSILTLKI